MTHINEAQNFLAHYGVLGMKWGVRKERKSTIRRPKKKQAFLTKEDKVGIAVSGGIAAAYLAYVGSFAVRNLVLNAAYRRVMAQGAAAASRTLLAIGPRPVVALTKGADGVFRLIK